MEKNTFEELLGQQKAFFRSGKTKDISFRIETLKKLKKVTGIGKRERVKTAWPG